MELLQERAEGVLWLTMNRPEVLECYATTGDADYLLRVMVPDTAAFERFLQETIFTRPAVQQVRSNFALRQVKYETAIPVTV